MGGLSIYIMNDARPAGVVSNTPPRNLISMDGLQTGDVNNGRPGTYCSGFLDINHVFHLQYSAGDERTIGETCASEFNTSMYTLIARSSNQAANRAAMVNARIIESRAGNPIV